MISPKYLQLLTDEDLQKVQDMLEKKTESLNKMVEDHKAEDSSVKAEFERREKLKTDKK